MKILLTWKVCAATTVIRTLLVTGRIEFWSVFAVSSSSSDMSSRMITLTAQSVMTLSLPTFAWSAIQSSVLTPRYLLISLLVWLEPSDYFCENPIDSQDFCPNMAFWLLFLCTDKFSYQDLSYKDQHWHGSCFLCISCKTSLVDTKFVRMSGQLYCGSCHENQFGPRCVGCGDVLRTGGGKVTL